MLFSAFLVSCNFFYSTDDKVAIFENKFHQNIFSSSKINIIHQEYMNTGSQIKRPYLTSQDLISFSFLNDDHLSLMYKLPKREQGNGTLRLFNFKNQNVIAELKNMSKLKIHIYPHMKFIGKKRDKLDAFSLLLDFYIEGKHYNIVISLYNIGPSDIQNNGKLKTSMANYYHQKNTSSERISKIPGAKVYSKNEKYQQSLLGSIKDRYEGDKIIFCHRVNKFCDDVKVNHCEKCRYGFYPIVDFNCPQGGSKICGMNFCGKKGMPACLRGLDLDFVKRMGKALCFDGSEAGFCGPGLTTVCDGRNVLICL